MPDYRKRNRNALIVLAIFLFLMIGYFRVYHGGDIGLRIVQKNSYSFKDTIVNLDDLLGQPRLVVAIQHPAVKRQLEEMGLIETDEQARERVRTDLILHGN